MRAGSDSFIEQIHVSDGQEVAQGDPLVTLRNDDVIRKRHELQLQIEQAQVRHRMALDAGDTPAVHVELSNVRALHEQLAEATRQFKALSVRAPVSGKVVRRSLANEIGNFVDEGSILLSIGKEDKKELVVSLAHDDLDRVAPSIGDQVRVRTGLIANMTGEFTRLEPRASDDVPYECLAATAGGPLPVVHTEDGASDAVPNLKLTHARFRGVVTMSAADSARLNCGQRVFVNVWSGSDRLGPWLVESIQDWIESKIDAVHARSP